jgi:hypothetical protein
MRCSTNYRKFLDVANPNPEAAPSMRAEAGRADQIVAIRDPATGLPNFEVRVVAVERIRGLDQARARRRKRRFFPAMKAIAIKPEDRPNENMCQHRGCGFATTTARFDYFINRRRTMTGLSRAWRRGVA